MWFSSTASVISWTCRARSAGIAGAGTGAVAAEGGGGCGPSAFASPPGAAKPNTAIRPIDAVATWDLFMALPPSSSHGDGTMSLGLPGSRFGGANEEQ